MKLNKSIPALPVKRIRQSCEYFSKRLGFKIRHEEQTFAIAVRDDVEIHLWQSCDNSWKWRSIFLAIKPVWTGAESFIAGTASCRIEVQDIEKLYEEYKSKSVLHSSETTIQAQYWGHKEFHAVDVDGNLLTFYEVMQ